MKSVSHHIEYTSQPAPTNQCNQLESRSRSSNDPKWVCLNRLIHAIPHFMVYQFYDMYCLSMFVITFLPIKKGTPFSDTASNCHLVAKWFTSYYIPINSHCIRIPMMFLVCKILHWIISSDPISLSPVSDVAFWLVLSKVHIPMISHEKTKFSFSEKSPKFLKYPNEMPMKFPF